MILKQFHQPEQQIKGQRELRQQGQGRESKFRVSAGCILIDFVPFLCSFAKKNPTELTSETTVHNMC